MSKLTYGRSKWLLRKIEERPNKKLNASSNKRKMMNLKHK
jgi:hypothetical protein